MHITFSHSHRLFLSTIFTSIFPHASCICIFPFAHLHFVLFSAVFGFQFLFWFSHFTTWGSTR